MNVRDSERWASALSGAALAAVGVSRFARSERAAGALLTTAAAGLIWRGATGHCGVYEAAGIDTANGGLDTRVQLGGRRGVVVDEAVAINRPAAELYSAWRGLDWLPVVLSDLVSVQIVDARRSHWIARGPAGRRLEWTAEIINEIADELIAWRTLGAADLVSAGSVRFTRASGDRGTFVKIKLQYNPPAGKVGAAVARLLGHDPSWSIREGLRRFKQLMEAGELPRNQTRAGGRS